MKASAKHQYKARNYQISLEELTQLYIEWGTDKAQAKRSAMYDYRIQASAYNASVRHLIIKPDSCCVQCGSTERLELDHIIQVGEGGKNELSNLQVMCMRCNRRKKPAHLLKKA